MRDTLSWELPLAPSPLRTERLPTNTTTYQHAVHRWFNFIAGFSPEFVHQCCEEVPASRRSRVLLDPFAGTGTSLVAARQIGFDVIGYEAHTVFERVAKAKVGAFDCRADIDQIERTLRSGLSTPASIDALPESPRIFLSKLAPTASLEALLGARRLFEAGPLRKHPLGFLLLSRLLDRCCHSQTDGIYKAPTSLKRSMPVLATFDDLIRMVRDDISHLEYGPVLGKWKIHGDSSENMSAVRDRTVSVIVTSPPYLNNFDFAEMTRMYLYFWGIANSWGEITDRVRSGLVVNTTTALKGHKPRQLEHRQNVPEAARSALDELVAQLRDKRKIKAGKKEYDFLVYPYFGQMTSVIRECHRALKKNGKLHMMVADAALYGVHISTPQILAEICDIIGFKNVECRFVRKRGHRWILEKREGSVLGLGEYEIIAER